MTIFQFDQAASNLLISHITTNPKIEVSYHLLINITKIIKINTNLNQDCLVWLHKQLQHIHKIKTREVQIQLYHKLKI